MASLRLENMAPKKQLVTILIVSTILTIMMALESAECFSIIPLNQKSRISVAGLRVSTRSNYRQLRIRDGKKLCEKNTATYYPMDEKHKRANGVSNDRKEQNLAEGGGIFSPQEILHPSFVFFNRIASKKNKTELPLFAAIEILSDALKKIIEDESFSRKDQGSDQSTTIRIDQLLHHTNSESISPLLWLRKCSMKPKIYFESSQKTIEVGGYGTSGSLLLTGDYHMTESDWDIISSLPSGIKVYGGGRFDPLLPIEKRGDEWQNTDFRGYYYMLPTVEMRKENDGKTFLSVNLHGKDIQDAAKKALDMLNLCPTSFSSPFTSSPPLLPPVLFRKEDTPTEEDWENGIQATLEPRNGVDKTVLSRKVDLFFMDQNGPLEKSPIDMLWKMKLAGHVGHFFFLEPSNESGIFWGCTPERLFSIDCSGKIQTEALAGTRTRGTDIDTDEALTSELLFSSPKDMSENNITKNYICGVLKKLKSQNLIYFTQDDMNKKPFVRRLRNLQHICQTIEAELVETSIIHEITRALLEKLNPTPAVCGYPMQNALEMIRKYESYDRGYYAGPFGYIGSDCADILVGIRSSLLTRARNEVQLQKYTHKLSVYAGAGIVKGSTPQAEWTETSHKHAVTASLFSPAPITMSRVPTANAAFSTVFIEELIRNGITMFYICPGSRSTPLTAAVAKTVKTQKFSGIVRAVSVHDERGAAYRAIGFARKTGRPAVVITSSGTAVGNLYPAIMEAQEDGVPLILLTADRPYEARGTGANQSIDQVKVFGTLVRWFRDIPAPLNDATVSILPALSDASHAVSMSKELMGPVHVNIQFRENLAPEAGPIRGDNRLDSNSHFHTRRYTDVPGFNRWASSSSKWQQKYSLGVSKNGSAIDADAVKDVTSLIMNSKRGLIIVGNTRVKGVGDDDQFTSANSIAHFARSIGFPIFASIMSGPLRNEKCSAVVPCSEHLLKNPKISKNLRPDLIIQIGAPIISIEINGIISQMIRENMSSSHVIIHPHSSDERADPEFTATHVISSFAPEFLLAVYKEIFSRQDNDIVNCASELAPLVLAGRALRTKMAEIIHDASTAEIQKDSINSIGIEKLDSLSEPQIILAISEVFQEEKMHQSSLFLSNSMPVRDAEFFMYPYEKVDEIGYGPSSVGVNRGASGIDGIISAATGFVDGNTMIHQGQKTSEEEMADVANTLLIGDLASLHDINALHGISRASSSIPLTTVIVNNNGGGIFSFLPVAKHSSDVGFEEFFGTATDSFSFQDGAKAFGLPYKGVTSFTKFKDAYRSGVRSGRANIIEAKVVDRSTNVKIHETITKQSIKFVDWYLDNPKKKKQNDQTVYLPHVVYNSIAQSREKIVTLEKTKTIVLLHGWMGSKNDWNETALLLSNELPSDYKIIAIDLPGHGDSQLLSSSPSQVIRKSLRLESNNDISENEKDKQYSSIDGVAFSVFHFLQDLNITNIDSICGYSLGGRVALAMKRISTTSNNERIHSLLSDSKVILLSSNPGELMCSEALKTKDYESRLQKDNALAENIIKLRHRSNLYPTNILNKISAWGPFLSKWYGASIWGNLQSDDSPNYKYMLKDKIDQLSNRAYDLAVILRSCSPPLNPTSDWKYVSPNRTLFVSGTNDKKYTKVGRQWKSIAGILHSEIPNAGHALLVESSDQVASTLKRFILETSSNLDDAKDSNFEESNLDIAKENMEKIVIQKSQESNPPQQTLVYPAALDFEVFSIDLISDRDSRGVSGIGWGEASTLNGRKQLNQRFGYVIQIISSNSNLVGIGEVSPLPGLHNESFLDAGEQLRTCQKMLSTKSSLLSFESESLLALDGSLSRYIDKIAEECGLLQDGKNLFFQSVKSGIEMSILSLASQSLRQSLPHAITSHFFQYSKQRDKKRSMLLPLNGLITRGSTLSSFEERSSLQGISHANKTSIQYASLKVKVGHQDIDEDIRSMLQSATYSHKGSIRADVNRAWNMSSALAFASKLNELEVDITDKIEFIEEPIEKKFRNQNDDIGMKWNIDDQLIELESWHQRTSLFYALDESVADLASLCEFDFDCISEVLIKANERKLLDGCAAFVLKPAVLGLELSLRISKLATEDLGINAVFSSSFDSGVGLAYCAFMAFASNEIQDANLSRNTFPHGLGTFDMLAGDTLTPSFGTYVNEIGVLNVAALGRALNGLSLDEMGDSLTYDSSYNELMPLKPQQIVEYQSVSSTSDSGREISVQVSLPLPFSDVIASSSFTDLPQQSRWSPWLSSVVYIPSDGETEWTLNVRGIEYRWRAVSTITNNPKGIAWESVSGVKNKGQAEFIPTSESTCVMTVKMKILTPRSIAFLFRGKTTFVEDFLQNKLLKWSLEMFRDVVKADLALDRGDFELGDALFGAAQGRANAIEATLSPEGINGNDGL